MSTCYMPEQAAIQRKHEIISSFLDQVLWCILDSYLYSKGMPSNSEYPSARFMFSAPTSLVYSCWKRGAKREGEQIGAYEDIALLHLSISYRLWHRQLPSCR